MLPTFCTSCGTSLPPGVIFCPSCGASVSAPPPAPTPATHGSGAPAPALLPICLGCGIVAPTEDTTCRQCGHAFGTSPPTVPRTTNGLYWAGIQASITCRACGGKAPIDGCDLQGPYPCIHCGIDQFADPAQWLEGLREAQEVVDLAGPGDGAFPSDVSIAENQYAPIGKRYVKATLSTSYTLGEGTPLEFDVSPGNPLCEACHVPMQVEAAADPLVVRCPQCNTSHTHPRPSGIPGELLGVVGHQHEKGVRDVAGERDPGGAVAIRCPGCSAPLPMAAVGAAITCSYCGVTSRIGPAMRRSMGSKDATPPRWWALFRGPSALRTRLEGAARAAVERSLRTAPSAERRDQPKPGPAVGKSITGVAVAAASVGVVFLGAVAFTLTRSTSTPSASTSPLTNPATPTAPAPPAPTFKVTWTGKVTSASGKPLRRNTACAAEMTAAGERVKRFRVECDSTSLYDSSAPFNGTSNHGAAIVEAPGSSGGHRYILIYNDVGQRTGRSEIQFNSASESTASSRGAPSFEVKMAFDDLSSERSGPAVFATSIDVSHALFDAKATSVVGKGPVKQGQTCKLDFQGRGVKSDGNVCTVKIDCAKKTVYYTTAYCTVDANGRPKAFSDKQASSHFSLDVASASAELGADGIASAYKAQFELSAVTR